MIILDGGRNSAFIQLCMHRVILSRMMDPILLLLWLVFHLTLLRSLGMCLLTPIVFNFPQCYAVNTIRSTSSSPRLLALPSESLARVYQQNRTSHV